MSRPAGWYPQSDGQQRYWDGEKWTEHFAPGHDPVTPSAIAPVTSPGAARKSWFLRHKLITATGALLLLAVFSGIANGSDTNSITVAQTSAAKEAARSAAADKLAADQADADKQAADQAATDKAAEQVAAAKQADADKAAAGKAAADKAVTDAAARKVAATKARAARHPATGSALAAVEGLTVKGRAPKTGYARSQFGQTWYDTDHNGCDTRNDILRRDLQSRQMKNSCKVLAGTLAPDPYTGTSIRFVYGGASEVDIDHVVALSDAWQKGAARWPAGKRLALANDPLNLLAVDASANRSKGDGDTATWLPANKSYRCNYVARQVAVKGKYGVWVTAAERDAMIRVLRVCPSMHLPGPGSASTLAAVPRSAKPAPQPAPAPQPVPPAPDQGVYYKNCTAVRAAGADPIRSGDPGYSRKLDRDGDGIGCE